MLDGVPVGADHEKVGADLAEGRLRSTFNYPASKIRNIHNLISLHMFSAFSSPKGARKFLNKTGDAADDLLTLRQADMTGKGQTPEEVAERTSVEKMRGLVEQAREQGAPTAQSMISVNGNDLLSLGLKPGPQVGTILRQLTNRVVESPQDNARDRLLQLAREYINALPDQPVRPTGPLQEERPM
jgi:tRNA nucleotidyltransferase (CCA-adding enzyme)